VPEQRAILDTVLGLQDDLESSMNEILTRLSERLERAAAHPFLQSPHRMYEERIRRVDELYGRLPEAVRRVLQNAQKDLQLQAEKLDAISPLRVLSRGYAIAEKLPEGAILRNAYSVKPGDKLRVRLHEGQIQCEVLP